MNVLSVVHGEDARTELFGPVAAESGHRLEEWSFGWGTPPPRPPDGYDAVLVFGGAMHADQEGLHPWLRDELDWLHGLLDRRVPTLGICLGSQLLARAAGGWIGPLAEPEIGWHEVELTEEGSTDPILSALPPRFTALEWHHYGHGLPEGAAALARNAAALQAFRLGETCWGVQFHPEVTEPQLERWIADKTDPPTDPERLLEETRARIGTWNELGSRLCRAFLAAAEHVGRPTR
jgi:GMP synthase (glutamine-hydrolysing)